MENKHYKLLAKIDVPKHENDDVQTSLCIFDVSDEKMAELDEASRNAETGERDYRKSAQVIFHDLNVRDGIDKSGAYHSYSTRTDCEHILYLYEDIEQPIN